MISKTITDLDKNHIDFSTMCFDLKVDCLSGLLGSALADKLELVEKEEEVKTAHEYFTKKTPIKSQVHNHSPDLKSHFEQNYGLITTRILQKNMLPEKELSTGSQHHSGVSGKSGVSASDVFDIEADEMHIEETSESQKMTSIASIMQSQKLMNTKFVTQIGEH